jgi:hypothetical protein
MGWAKYQEDDVSRYWRDAKTQARMGCMADERKLPGQGDSKDVGKLKQLRRHLTDSPSEVFGGIHGDDRNNQAAQSNKGIAQGREKVLKDFTVARQSLTQMS